MTIFTLIGEKICAAFFHAERCVVVLETNVYFLFYSIIMLCWDWPQLMKQCLHILSDIYGYSSNKVIVSQTSVYCHIQSTYLTVAKCSNYMEFYAVSQTFW